LLAAVKVWRGKLDRYIRYYHRTIKDYPRSKFNIETGLAAVEAGCAWAGSAEACCAAAS